MPRVSMVSWQGIRIDALEKVSVMVSIVSYVLEMGSLMMKSMAIEVNGVLYVSDEIGNKGGLGLFG
jgi:hypothetical protein